MKTDSNKLQIDFESQASRPASIQNSKFKIQNCSAFTLIELLVVISIIAILAGFTIPVMSSLKRRELINKTLGEMAQLQTAIDSYKAAYGFYPPGNGNTTAGTLKSALTNQLYFELLGTTNLNTTTGVFQTLDGSAQISTANATKTFTVSGIMNSSKPNGEDTSQQARNFLSDLRVNQSAVLFTNGTDVVRILVASVGEPDQAYHPLGPNVTGLNPWRYAYPGINNPNSYDLWVQLSINGATNLICNWNKEVQKNTTLP